MYSMPRWLVSDAARAITTMAPADATHSAQARTTREDFTAAPL
jgi:hypothetical protein